jgi:peptidoglycan/LPS O-acetylase OafA/YrhL
MSAEHPAPATRQRDGGIDRIKAIAIVCVVAIHSVNLWGRRDLGALVVSATTSWGVPAFFLVSGYLHSRITPYPNGTLARWCRRLLPTYIAATVVALAFRGYVLGEPTGLSELPVALLVGSGWGIYYFVPVLLGALCLSLVFARYPKTVPLAAIFFLPSLIVVRFQPGFDPIIARWGQFGMFRTPVMWWGFFISGWIAAAPLRKHRRGPAWLMPVFASMAALGFLLLFVTDGWFLSPLRATALALTPYAVTTSIMLWSDKPAGRLVLWLSDFSYEIYLLHLFIVVPAQKWLIGMRPSVWEASVLGAAAIVASVVASRAVATGWGILRTRLLLNPKGSEQLAGD